MPSKWGSLSEIVRRDRIKVAVAAWAYEHDHHPIMSDKAYDELSALVAAEINIATGDHRMDRFFQRHFQADTGLWIHKHPDPRGLENIYVCYYQKSKKWCCRKRR